jgi:hypothetical protein
MAKKKRPLARRPRPSSAVAKNPAEKSGEEEGLDLPSEEAPEAEEGEVSETDASDASEPVGSTEADLSTPDVEEVDAAEVDENDADEAEMGVENDTELEESVGDLEGGEAPGVVDEEVESVAGELDGSESESACDDADGDIEEGSSRESTEGATVTRLELGLVGDGIELDESEVEDTEHYLKGLVEALIFSSDRPQTTRDVARAAKIDSGRAQELIELLIVETKGRGVRLVEVSEAYALRISRSEAGAPEPRPTGNACYCCLPAAAHSTRSG